MNNENDDLRILATRFKQKREAADALVASKALEDEKLQMQAEATKVLLKRYWPNVRNYFTFAAEVATSQLFESEIKVIEKASTELVPEIFTQVEYFCSDTRGLVNPRIILRVKALANGQVEGSLVNKVSQETDTVLSGSVESVTQDAATETVLRLIRAAESK
jgi:hypothetical protein